MMKNKLKNNRTPIHNFDVFANNKEMSFKEHEHFLIGLGVPHEEAERISNKLKEIIKQKNEQC